MKSMEDIKNIYINQFLDLQELAVLFGKADSTPEA